MPSASVDLVPPPMPRLLAGRRLKEAPAWPDSDGALFFDVTSGDYWVLAPDAAEVLRRVMSGQPVEDATSATLESLLGAGLLACGPSGTG